MDLRSLGGSPWKGFSDQELQGIKKSSSSLSAPVDARPNTSTHPEHKQSVTPNTTAVSAATPTIVEIKSIVEKTSQQEATESCDLVEPGELLEEQLRRRQEIEEANKKKKKALEETISLRYKQTRAESSKLEMVKNELAKLDQLVTKDVAILRDTIETTSRDYTAAKLRFEKAESEYVSAKLALATTKEKKDLLSQHLCSVIQENEQRKAAKLTELMSQLDILNEQS